MARIIHTDQLAPGQFDKQTALFVYNGLDCCITGEVHARLQEQIEPVKGIYRFERDCLAPALEMMLRGTKIDLNWRSYKLDQLHRQRRRVRESLEYLTRNLWGLACNPNSQQQLKEVFYTRLGIQPIEVFDKGELKEPMNREVLEKLLAYIYARPFAQLALRFRDLDKKIQALSASAESDGRMRSSYNVGATETGRWSSSKGAFGGGLNDQTWTKELRELFVADEGYELFQSDLEQAEARAVAYLAQDEKFITACECLTANHEVLTPEGWKPISEKPNTIMQAWSNGTCNFTPVAYWHESTAEHLLHFRNSSFSLSCTYNHKLPGNKTAKEVASLASYTLPLASTYIEGEPQDLARIRLLAAFQADGHMRPNGGVRFNFKKERKITRITHLLQDCGFSWSEYYLKHSVEFYIHRKHSKQMEWPKQAGAYVLEWDSEALAAYIEEHRFWDGSTDDQGLTRITAKDKSHLDWLQTVAHLTGIAATINQHKQDYWRLTLKSWSTTQTRSMEISEDNSSQQVYCPTVPAGYFLVRYQGKVSITGNSGDLWTFACKLIWPGLDWSGNLGYAEDLTADKEVAEQKFFRHFSYRDMAKRGGHAFDYMATARTVAKHLGIPVDVAETFGRKWFEAFPQLRRWQQQTVQEVQIHGYLTTPLGRRRHFLGRLRDDSTLREAVAYRPQSTIADLLNIGLLDLWRKGPSIGLQPLKQVHDAVVGQYPIGQRDNAVALVRSCLERPIDIYGKSMVVPCDFAWGFNWGPQTKDNPDGLAGYKPNQQRSRQRPATNNLLHRQVS